MKEIQKNIAKTCDELNRITAYVRLFANLSEREEGAMIQIDAESFDKTMSEIANTLAVAQYQLDTINNALGLLKPNADNRENSDAENVTLCRGVKMSVNEFYNKLLNRTEVGRTRLLLDIAETINATSKSVKAG